MAKCSPKASKKGRLVIKLVHKATGEFYTTVINSCVELACSFMNKLDD